MRGQPNRLFGRDFPEAVQEDCLRELILANIAEAEFIKAAVR
jgi:hypothetical protein